MHPFVSTYPTGICLVVQKPAHLMKMIHSLKSVLVLQLYPQRSKNSYGDVEMYSIRIPFKEIPSYPLFQTIYSVSEHILHLIQSSSSPSSSSLFQSLAWPLSSWLTTVYDLLVFPSPSLPNLRNRADGETYMDFFRKLVANVLQLVCN